MSKSSKAASQVKYAAKKQTKAPAAISGASVPYRIPSKPLHKTVRHLLNAKNRPVSLADLDLADHRYD